MSLRDDPSPNQTTSGYRYGMRTILPPNQRELPPPTGQVPFTKLTIPLRLITPMIGGGVVALEPDPANPARATAIRGAWRWWWRALWGGTTEEMREAEGLLFGAVGTGTGDARASLLRVRTRVAQTPDAGPAGVHRANAQGRSTPRVDWDLKGDLGYAAFPLMRSQEDMASWTGPGSLPTRKVIRAMRFELEISVDELVYRRRVAEARPVAPDVAGQMLVRRAIDGALEALRWWIHMGGLGGRTRRGFGALALDGEVTVRGAEGPVWATTAWWKEKLTLPDGAPSADRPSLRGATLLVGPPQATAEKAHELLVKDLAWFRQGRGFARDPGTQPNRPGESRWPEVSLVKLRLKKRTTFDHPPRPAAARVDATTLAPPRTAFGMPLLIRFKRQDARDAEADADLVPSEGERWPSPVLLRPVLREGRFVPVVLILAGGAQLRTAKGGLRVNITFDQGGEAQGIAPVGTIGAEADIERLLTLAGGDAIQAYRAWLRTRDFKEPS